MHRQLGVPVQSRQAFAPRIQTTSGRISAALGPSILAGGERHYLLGASTIGRIHHGCPLEECKRNGFWRSPDIALWDNNRYVGKHHATVTVDSNLLCWIEDLESKNGTGILRRGPLSRASANSPYYFETLLPRRRYRLMDGDIVALAYNIRRGPYLMFTFCSE